MVGAAVLLQNRDGDQDTIAQYEQNRCDRSSATCKIGEPEQDRCECEPPPEPGPRLSRRIRLRHEREGYAGPNGVSSNGPAALYGSSSRRVERSDWASGAASAGCSAASLAGASGPRSTA